MAPPTIDTAFVKQYEAEVQEAYQRRGSKLRGMVRTVNGVVGNTTTFQKTGKGTATTKGRHATIPPMNLSHGTAECTLADYYAGDWIDKLDLLKVRHDERQVVANAGAWALGRKTDELIITALDTAGSGQTVPDGAGDLDDAVGLTKAKVMAGLRILNAADVPDDGRRVGLISATGWSGLMGITEFASSDYVQDKVYEDGWEMRRWLGVTWVRHTGLPVSSTLVRQFIFHPSAVGHAIGADITADITWHGDRAAHWVNHMMSQGACLIDETGIARINITE